MNPAPPASGPARGGASRPSADVPTTVAVLTVLVLLEAAALVALVAWWCVRLVGGAVQDPGAGAFLALFAAGVAAVLVGSARALRTGRRIGRAPVATWQILQGATALVLQQATGLTALWALVVGVSVVVFLLLLTRPVVEHTVRPPSTSG